MQSTVYEKKSEGTLGYDWTDIFAPNALEIAGIPMPPENKFEYKEDIEYGQSVDVYIKKIIPEKKKIKLKII